LLSAKNTTNNNSASERNCYLQKILSRHGVKTIEKTVSLTFCYVFQLNSIEIMAKKVSKSSRKKALQRKNGS